MACDHQIGMIMHLPVTAQRSSLYKTIVSWGTYLLENNELLFLYGDHKEEVSDTQMREEIPIPAL